LDTVLVDETDPTLYHATISGADGDSITLTVDASMITDVSINHNVCMLGAGVDGVGNYVVGDHVAPEILSVHANVADTAATASPFTVDITFSEPVVNTAAGITVNGAPANIISNTGNVYKVSISGVDYQMMTLAVTNAITDASLNANPLANPGSWVYKIGDITPPTVQFMANPDPQTKTFDVTLKFSEPVNKVTVTGVLRAVGGSIVAISGADGDSQYVVTLSGESFAEVTLTVSTVVVDLSGNNLAAPASATYTIGDYNPPMVTELTPTGDVGDDTTFPLMMTFDEPVVAGSGTLKVYTGTTEVASFNISDVIVYGNTVKVPMVSLDKLTNYFVLVTPGFVKDTNGNNFGGIMSVGGWTFKTGNFAVEVPTIENIQFKVYPSPFDDYIKIDNADKLTRVLITNITGQTVIDKMYPEQVVRTPNLVSGVYFVSLFTEDGIVKTERIVKR
jgi:hypothetical protein